MNHKHYLIIILLSMSIFTASGQIKNNVDFFIKYNYGILLNDFSHNYHDNSGVLLPTIFGNIKYSKGIKIGFLLSGHSFYYQPGIVIGYNNYIGNRLLFEKYNRMV